jgi:hypothetical protein
VLDTINIERRGIPAAVVGLDKLLNSVGRAMARAQGYPSLKFAMIPYSQSELGDGAAKEKEIEIAEHVMRQVERILTGMD